MFFRPINFGQADTETTPAQVCPETTPIQAASAPTTTGFPWGWLLAAGGAALVLFGSKKGKKKSKWPS